MVACVEPALILRLANNDLPLLGPAVVDAEDSDGTSETEDINVNTTGSFREELAAKLGHSGMTSALSTSTPSRDEDRSVKPPAPTRSAGTKKQLRDSAVPRLLQKAQATARAGQEGKVQLSRL